MSEIKSLYEYELCDASARERLDAIEDELGLGIEYDTREDWGEFLRSIELTEMRKTGVQLTYNTSTGVVTAANVTTGYNVYIFDPEKLPDYAKVVAVGNFYVYDGTSSYTYFGASSATTQGNYGAFDFTSIPDGSYLCYCSKLPAYQTYTGIMLRHVIARPDYVSAIPGLDESLIDKPLDLPIVVKNGAAYIVMDVSAYKYHVLRVTGSTIFRDGSYFAKNNTAYTSSGSTFVTNDFDCVRSGDWLMLCVQGLLSSAPNVRIGVVTPAKAKQWKSEKRFLNARHFTHNADDKKQLIMSCVVSDVIDIDLCRTLDDNYVCIHGFSINNKTIVEYNLADLGLTGDQMERDESLEILRTYGSYCMYNFRETDDFDKRMEAVEKSYTICGDAVIYKDFITTGYLSNIGKYRMLDTEFTDEQLAELAPDKSKIFRLRSINSADYHGDAEYTSRVKVTDITKMDPKCRFNYYYWDNANATTYFLQQMAKLRKIENIDLTDKWDLTAYAEYPYRVLYLTQDAGYILLASKYPLYAGTELTNDPDYEIITHRVQPRYAKDDTVYSSTNNPSVIAGTRTNANNTVTKNGTTYSTWDGTNTRWRPVWTSHDLLNWNDDSLRLSATASPVWGIANIQD